MGKSMKLGKVVIVLAGRYAGQKAVIAKNVDGGTICCPYIQAIVAGIYRYCKRSKIFVQVFNYNFIPTRYLLLWKNLTSTRASSGVLRQLC
uniref:60S ribosomal protein L27 n=1 Tax=Cyprinodon variegatus TaxID=28743 RepID=A0A3Q2FYD6_CYPVA